MLRKHLTKLILTWRQNASSMTKKVTGMGKTQHKRTAAVRESAFALVLKMYNPHQGRASPVRYLQLQHQPHLELERHPASQTPPQMYWIRICILAGSQGIGYRVNWALVFFRALVTSSSPFIYSPFPFSLLHFSLSSSSNSKKVHVCKLTSTCIYSVLTQIFKHISTWY